MCHIGSSKSNEGSNQMNMAVKTRVSTLLVMAMWMAGCEGGDVPVNEKSNVATRVDVAQTRLSPF